MLQTPGLLQVDAGQALELAHKSAIQELLVWDRVIWPSWHLMQAGFGTVLFPPGEYQPLKHEEHDDPPLPAAQTVAVQEARLGAPVLSVVLPVGQAWH